MKYKIEADEDCVAITVYSEKSDTSSRTFKIDPAKLTVISNYDEMPLPEQVMWHAHFWFDPE